MSEIREELRASLRTEIENLTKKGIAAPVHWLMFLCDQLKIKASDLADLAYNDVFDEDKYQILEDFYLEHIK